MVFSGLSEPLRRAVQAYAAPTPVQEQVIPAVLRGEDIIASARTGSGKTAAFALPILQLLHDYSLKKSRARQGTQVLVLTATRELAAQIGESFRTYARYLPEAPRVVAVFGGISINPQMMALRGGVEVVVGTPGRLLDLIGKNALSLEQISILVLDEADRMLSLGFAEELDRILALLPARRQNLLLSATFPAAVQTLARNLAPGAIRIEIETGEQPDIQQRTIEVDASRRTALLRHLIAENKWARVLVFVATKYATGHIAQKLRGYGIKATAFQGEMTQGARTQALADFKASRIQVLVATDVAARGIDIAQLPVVVNYDLPRSTVEYIHRIGRTGRAGESGIAVTFVTAAAHAHFQLIEKRHQLTIPREQIEGFEPLETAPPVIASTGGIKGRRPSKKDKIRAGLRPR